MKRARLAAAVLALSACNAFSGVGEFDFDRLPAVTSSSGSGAGGAASSSATGGATNAGGGGEGGGTFALVDPLVDTTLGEQHGGTLGAEGWTVDNDADRIIYTVPRLVEGHVQVTVTSLTLATVCHHDLLTMYESGYDVDEPIEWDPELLTNHFRVTLRVFGNFGGSLACDDTQVGVNDEPGLQHLDWRMCPAGAPGYGNGCPCEIAEGPIGGDGGTSWDGTPQLLRLEWDLDGARYYRNGTKVHELDWSSAQLWYGPEEMKIAIGSPRPLVDDDATMPIGAVFSDLEIGGTLGAQASCP